MSKVYFEDTLERQHQKLTESKFANNKKRYKRKQ